MAAKYDFSRSDILGEGVYGIIFKATRKCDSLEFAIKKIDAKTDDDGLDFSAIREIKVLKELKNDYIVNLVEVFVDKMSVYLVLELCFTDLHKIVNDPNIIIPTSHTKKYMHMMLSGINHLHQRFILHRDLKPANLLITENGVLKIADFGLCRSLSRRMTNDVISLGYKPPELLLGADMYSFSVDMWSIGCIFAEVIFRKTLFPALNPADNLARIFNVLGTPSVQSWPHRCSLLPAYIEFEERKPLDLKSLFRDSEGMEQEDPPDLDLLLKLLALDPLARMSASDALKHRYFELLPLPCQCEELQLPGDTQPLKKGRFAEKRK